MKHKWEYKRLGDIGEIVTGSTPPTSKEEYYSSLDYMFIKPGDLCEDKVSFLEKSDSYISKLAFETATRKLPINSILVTCIGTIGKVGILLKEATCNQQINAIVPNEEINSKYVAYALISIQSELRSRANGPVVRIINKSLFSSFYIPVPPMEEQERIVAELDALNGTIVKCRELLATLDSLAQSLFYDTFGDPISNPKGWDLKKLNTVLCKIGSGATPRGGKQSYLGGKINLIRSLNVYNSYFKYEELARINDEQAYELRNVEVRNDDILLNITGASVARCCIVPLDVLPARVNQHVAILRPIHTIINPVYLHRLIISKSLQQELLRLARGKNATREALPKATLEDIFIQVPPLSLQEAFARKIKAIEAQKVKVEATMTEVQKLLDSRMDYWFN